MVGRRRPGPDLLGSSVIHEPSAREREKQGRRERRPRRGPRPHHWRALGLAVVAVAVVAGVTVVLAEFAARGGPDAEHRRSGEQGLQSARDYRPGDCVTWNQDDRSAVVPTVIVPCEGRHLLEMTEPQLIEGMRDAPYPLEAQWLAIIKETCRGPAERYLGGALDPDGRYRPSAFTLWREDWDRGDRTVQCALTANWSESPWAGAVGDTASTGSARTTSQHWSYRVGDCLIVDDPYTHAVSFRSRQPVPCDGLHAFEVTGEITLADTKVPAPGDDAGWANLVGDVCTTRGRPYLARPDEDGAAFAEERIQPRSWAAGKRNVTCVVGLRDAQGWRSWTGSIHTGAPVPATAPTTSTTTAG